MERLCPIHGSPENESLPVLPDYSNAKKTPVLLQLIMCVFFAKPQTPYVPTKLLAILENEKVDPEMQFTMRNNISQFQAIKKVVWQSFMSLRKVDSHILRF